MMSNQNIEDNVEQIYDKYDNRQKSAVEAILDDWNSNNGDFVFPIVDGPPGTGKTSVGTIAAAKYTLENKNSQVGYLCYTHYAIQKARDDLLSYGFPNDRVVELHYDRNLKDFNQGIFGCDSDLKSASLDEKRRLRQCSVLLCTLHSSRRVFSSANRPKVIIDEFSQVSTPMFFTVLQKAFAQKGITQGCYPDGYALLGDPIQLPVISTQPLLRPNIGIYIMQRKPHDNHQFILQHRMHKDICEAVNQLRNVSHAYPIETAAETKDRDLQRLGYSWNEAKSPPDLVDILDPSKPLTIVNTDNCGEEGRIFGGSVKNIKEAKLATRIAIAVRETYSDASGKGLEPCILSPYGAQIGEIRQGSETLSNNCITVYRAQGREYPCVIISFVRNNDQGNIGFLGSENEFKEQTYVACSRAQAKLIVLMSFKTFLNKGHTEFEALYKTKRAHMVG
jgi:superfamily I DNA and/or RNA helicase